MFDITTHVCLSFVAKDVKTHANLLPDFSLQISPVQHSDYEIWRCEQHVLRTTSEKTYKLYNGKKECVFEKQVVEKRQII